MLRPWFSQFSYGLPTVLLWFGPHRDATTPHSPTDPPVPLDGEARSFGLVHSEAEADLMVFYVMGFNGF